LKTLKILSIINLEKPNKGGYAMTNKNYLQRYLEAV
jgi:hypothetical protein